MKRSVIVCLLLAACGSASVSASVSASDAPLVRARWTAYVHASEPIDLVGPRADATLVVAAGGRLWVLGRSGALRPFAPGYHSNPGLEAYIALSPGGCFGRDTLYALSLGSPRGVTAVSAHGQARRFAIVTARGLLNGITFGFGGRLLVTVGRRSHTTVLAIDCHGAASVITRSAPRVEGGIAVAPKGFGRFAGDLIAPDEIGGNLYAITPAGKSVLVAASALPHGGDTGVESEGFLPRGRFEALLADRLTPHNHHPGDNVILRVSSAALFAAGARPGDLLVATEGGARTDAIRCTATGCRIRRVADGPRIAHAEGHIAFVH